jgi:hypothetical protein
VGLLALVPKHAGNQGSAPVAEVGAGVPLRCAAPEGAPLTALFERLFELIQAWFRYLIPWAILGDDECGLIRRLGCYHRDMSPGWNWKWPVLEQAMTECSALDSDVLREQTLTTRDGHQVTLRGVLTYHVVDARKYIIGVDSAESVINDVGSSVIAEVVPGIDLKDVLQGESFNVLLLRKVRARAKKWGVAVDSFGLVDRVATRTYRIIGMSSDSKPSGS